MTHEEKCHKKFIRRKNLLIGRNIYPLGYNTTATWINEHINLKASIAKDIEATKQMIWECNGKPSRMKLREFNNLSVLQTSLLFPNHNIKQFKNGRR